MGCPAAAGPWCVQHLGPPAVPLPPPGECPARQVKNPVRRPGNTAPARADHLVPEEPGPTEEGLAHARKEGVPCP